MDRVDKLVTTDVDKEQEKQHVQKALQANGYKSWMFKSPKPRKKKDSSANNNPTNRRINVPLPYIRGISEKLNRIFRDHGVNAYHKPINTIRSFLVHPKDKTPDCDKCGVVYKINCSDCKDTYVGETARAMSVRFDEHTTTDTSAPLTAVGEHTVKHKHEVDIDNVQIICREDHFWNRKIRESVEIRTHKPTLNRDSGYDLPAIYSDLLSLDLPQGHVTGGR